MSVHLFYEITIKVQQLQSKQQHAKANIGLVLLLERKQRFLPQSFVCAVQELIKYIVVCFGSSSAE